MHRSTVLKTSNNLQLFIITSTQQKLSTNPYHRCFYTSHELKPIKCPLKTATNICKHASLKFVS